MALALSQVPPRAYWLAFSTLFIAEVALGFRRDSETSGGIAGISCSQMDEAIVRRMVS